ncbi:MAG: leucyl/phenylalanyl-tRNA--protein transferase [Myxococcales bacterium]
MDKVLESAGLRAITREEASERTVREAFGPWCPVIRGVRPGMARRLHFRGQVAFGGRLDPDDALTAYRTGAYPRSGRKPIPWMSPDPRAVLFPGKFKAPKVLRQTRDLGEFEVTWDEDFAGVISAFAKSKWISPSMARCYDELHRRGVSHSMEVWKDGELAGGLFGIEVGGVFSVAAAFSREASAVELALWALTERGYSWIDCQEKKTVWGHLGVRPVSRDRYLKMLKAELGSEWREPLA